MTKFKSTERMKEIIAEYYLEAKNAEHNKKILAWVTSGAPVEHLYAMDVIPVYPENYAAMCGASHTSLDLINVSEGMGYSPDLCSYAKSDIGADMTQGGPIFGLPRPDFLVCGTNICRTVMKWYQVIARKYQVPLILIDMPFSHNEIEKEHIEYVKMQFRDLERFLSNYLKKPFDRDRFQSVVEKSAMASFLWRKILKLGAHVPSPINSFDTFIHMAPIVTLRGTDRAVEYYSKLLDEVTDLANRNVGSIKNEKMRLLWDNLPIWDRIKFLSELFGNRDTALVVATYTNGWAAIDEGVDPSMMEEELARAYLGPFLNRGFQYRIGNLCGLVDEFKLNGLVFHSNRSCKSYSLGQYFIGDEVQKRTGKPYLVIESDMNDPRQFSEAQIETRVSAFIEKLLS